MTFLDYYKNVLSKVTFDPHLFNKEYRKATGHLHSEEVNELNKWLASAGFLNILRDQSGGEAMTAKSVPVSPRFFRGKNLLR